MFQICKLQESGQGETHWEGEQRVPFYTNGNLWVGFDDDRSIEEKVSAYISKMQSGHLALFIYEIENMLSFVWEGRVGAIVRKQCKKRVIVKHNR